MKKRNVDAELADLLSQVSEDERSVYCSLLALVENVIARPAGAQERLRALQQIAHVGSFIARTSVRLARSSSTEH